jgi:hypothetical protein
MLGPLVWDGHSCPSLLTLFPIFSEFGFTLWLRVSVEDLKIYVGTAASGCPAGQSPAALQKPSRIPITSGGMIVPSK